MTDYIQHGPNSLQIGKQYNKNIHPDLTVKYFNNFYKHLFILSTSSILSTMLLYLFNSNIFLASICFILIYHSYYISKNMNFIYVYANEKVFVKAGIRYFLEKNSGVYVLDIQDIKYSNKIKIIKNNNKEENIIFATARDKNLFLENINIYKNNISDSTESL